MPRIIVAASSNIRSIPPVQKPSPSVSFSNRNLPSRSRKKRCIKKFRFSSAVSSVSSLATINRAFSLAPRLLILSRGRSAPSILLRNEPCPKLVSTLRRRPAGLNPPSDDCQKKYAFVHPEAVSLVRASKRSFAADVKIRGHTGPLFR